MEFRQVAIGHGVGDWCWHARHATPCRVVDRRDIWGETAYRVWLPTKDAVVRIATLDDAEASVPDLNAVMMLRIGELKIGTEGAREAQIT